MKSTNSQGNLRIIGGRWRSRRLSFPLRDQLRPTANRIRETLFNWLQEKVPFEDCLDLFAGSGACGLEALSRGAASVTFVEQDRQVADAIGANLALLEEPEMPVICRDAMEWLQDQAGGNSQAFGIVFIDPPYADRLEIECCRLLEKSGLLKDQATIYLESNRDLSESLFPAGWRIIRKKRAGAVHYMLLQRQSAASKPEL
ncbi:MAG: 16S rRNA (guanine(966)-N(2))-methyltransferase RsmD [Gammaproteobacteria bacterium]|nr:16S rRNA (guanine(966)-N(2))-methyltransferase RsmD [Gammaproteobacteria bacterium]